MRIAIQGEPGSNSNLAVDALLGPQTLVACAASAAVFAALAQGAADAAVLPIENSLHGAVAEHYDLLLEHPVSIVAETALRIRHALIGALGSTLTTVRRVLSHPVALNQCRHFFREHPGIAAVPSYDTAGAVRQVIASGALDEAAIAAPYAAEVYGGSILRRDLEDDPLNFTRFFLLARSGEADAVRAKVLSLPAAEDRMSVAFAIPHRPGSLVAVLQALAHTGADLTRIESRPVAGKPWEYVFFVDLRLPSAAHADGIGSLLAGQCSTFRELGRYGTVEAGGSTPQTIAGIAVADSR